MYLSRVILERIPPPNIIHGVISVAFPGKRSDRANENLWRIDCLGDSNSLLVLSINSPTISHIIEEIGVDDNRNGTIDYDPFLAQIKIGQTWRFRLCANPVKHISNSLGGRGKVCALHSESDQFEWLGEQGVKHGFNVNRCFIASDEWRMFGGSRKRGTDNIVRIRAVTYDGMLTVTDPSSLCAVLKSGIGRGKAYGCGLLTIARVSP